MRRSRAQPGSAAFAPGSSRLRDAELELAVDAGVGAGVAVALVLIVPTVEGAVASVREPREADRIGSRAAGVGVGIGVLVGGQRVVAGAAVDRVGAIAADHRVVAGATEDLVGAVGAVDRVIAPRPTHP